MSSFRILSFGMLLTPVLLFGASGWLSTTACGCGVGAVSRASVTIMKEAVAGNFNEVVADMSRIGQAAVKSAVATAPVGAATGVVVGLASGPAAPATVPGMGLLGAATGFALGLGMGAACGCEAVNQSHDAISASFGD